MNLILIFNWSKFVEIILCDSSGNLEAPWQHWGHTDLITDLLDLKLFFSSAHAEHSLF